MREDYPLISVVVPVYNVESYLEKCVRSIQNQTYSNLEIILVDDGSPDRCGKMCDELAEKDARIKVVHRENGGLSAARNSGIEASTGEYISFVDSDDYIDSDMLEGLYKAMAENNAELSVCDAKRISEKGEVLKKKNYSGSVTKYSGNEAKKFLLQSMNNSVCNKLFKKELIGELRFPEGRIHGEDFIFILQYLRVVNSISVLDEAKYNYVIREQSITHSVFSKSSLDDIACKDEISTYIEKYFPDFSGLAEKWAFKARMNVVRGIMLGGSKAEWNEEKKTAVEYLKKNYSRAQSRLSGWEKFECLLQRRLIRVYPGFLRLLLLIKKDI